VNQIDSNSQRRGAQTKHTIKQSAMVGGKDTVKVTKKTARQSQEMSSNVSQHGEGEGEGQKSSHDSLKQCRENCH